MPLNYDPVLWTRAEVESILKPERLTPADGHWQATGISRRPVRVEDGELFIAGGETNEADLHQAVPEALRRGAVAAIVSGPTPPLPSWAPVYKVPNVKQALIDLAVAARERSRARVVAVTGSVGKTGVKDALGQILGQQRPTYANYRNDNCGWGVPTAVAALPREVDYAVLEMGMLGPKSIVNKTAHIRPHVGLITAIAPAHRAYHKSMDSIARTKVSMIERMEPGSTVILPRDSEWFSLMAELAQAAPRVERILSFGRHPEADIRLLDSTTGATSSEITARVVDREVRGTIGVGGEHWVDNCLGILATVYALEADVDCAAHSLLGLRASFRRGERFRAERKSGSEIVEVIDDSWNANPRSMTAALESVAAMELPPGGRRIAVLGDMLELGADEGRMHEDLAPQLERLGFDQVHVVGELMRRMFDKLPREIRGEAFLRPASLARHVDGCVRHGDVVLVKGSNKMELWRTVKTIVPNREYARSAPPQWSVALEVRERGGRSFSPPAPEQKPPAPADPHEFDISVLDDDARAELAAFVRAHIQGDDTRALASSCFEGMSTGPVYCGLWAEGRVVAEAWASVAGEGTAGAVRGALERALESYAGSREAIAHVAFSIAHDTRVLRPYTSKRDARRLYSNIHRGVWSIEIEYAGEYHRWSPFEVVARNRDFKKVLDGFRAERGFAADEFFGSGTVKQSSSHQFLIPAKGSDGAIALHRAGRLVRPEQITRAGVEGLSRRMTDYLVRHVADDGALTYLIEPARGEDLGGANNMIRQWMATIALQRATRRQPERPELAAAAERNLAFNLATYYRLERGLGLIDYKGKAKLGAIALAALAIMESPEPERYADPRDALLRAIDHAWSEGQAPGRFMTILRPPGHDIGQNFYPGEALLTWAHVYDRSRDSALLERIMTSYRHYREWHLECRNPAFVPWHALTYESIWTHTRDRELAAWVFEMTDWLIAVMQQIHSPVYPDVAGRFYSPERPDFGLPHSSSTGVYMEGIVAAFRLAKALGDADRVERYRLALVRGIRSCWQLSLDDEHEAFYAKDPARCVGGVRVSVFNNELRCDNLQHNLMAIFDVLDVFHDEEFAHPDPVA